MRWTSKRNTLKNPLINARVLHGKYPLTWRQSYQPGNNIVCQVDLTRKPRSMPKSMQPSTKVTILSNQMNCTKRHKSRNIAAPSKVKADLKHHTEDDKKWGCPHLKHHRKWHGSGSADDQHHRHQKAETSISSPDGELHSRLLKRARLLVIWGIWPPSSVQSTLKTERIFKWLLLDFIELQQKWKVPQTLPALTQVQLEKTLQEKSFILIVQCIWLIFLHFHIFRGSFSSRKEKLLQT